MDPILAALLVFSYFGRGFADEASRDAYRNLKTLLKRRGADVDELLGDDTEPEPSTLVEPLRRLHRRYWLSNQLSNHLAGWVCAGRSPAEQQYRLRAVANIWCVARKRYAHHLWAGKFRRCCPRPAVERSTNGLWLHTRRYDEDLRHAGLGPGWP